jgi:hypothetical protein
MRKQLRVCRAVTVSLACVAWLLPVHEIAAAPPIPGAATTGVMIDVRLDPWGAVRGRLLDAGGQPLANRPVVLQQADGASLAAQTDVGGGFVLHRVSAGVHRLTVGDETVNCRVWTHAAAPPSAADQLTVVAGQTIIRGQQPFSAIFTNPLFIGLVIAAAIAIPIAVHNSQSDRPPGS